MGILKQGFGRKAGRLRCRSLRLAPALCAALCLLTRRLKSTSPSRQPTRTAWLKPTKATCPTQRWFTNKQPESSRSTGFSSRCFLDFALQYSAAVAEGYSKTVRGAANRPLPVYDFVSFCSLLFLLLQLDTILFEGYRAAGDYESSYVHQAHRLNYVTQVRLHPNFDQRLFAVLGRKSARVCSKEESVSLHVRVLTPH